MQNIIQLYRNTMTMTHRCILLSKRNVDTWITCLALPVLMMTLFVYVLGGAMNVGDISYVDYIVPGIIIQCIGQCASTTAITVNNDAGHGILERYYTMPIQKSSILWGHVISAVLRNLLSAIIVIVVAFVIGFRPTAQGWDWLMIIVLLVLYILMLSWLSLYIGIKAHSPEGAGACIVFASVLPYISSGFVPVDTMPDFLRLFAENQPMTPIIESLRSLFMHTPLDSSTLFSAVVWCIGLMIVFYLLSKRALRHKLTA